jgi:hypothetical protein
MATIIPNYCITDSDGERSVFNALRDNPKDTSDWVVIHSQNLKHVVGQANVASDLNLREIDFLLLIPGRGIILLEVKGGKISAQNGSFQTTNRFGQTNPIDPATQLREATGSLMKYLKANLPWFPHGVVFDSAIVFPQSPSPIKKLIDLDEIQIIDSVKIQEVGVVESIRQLSQRVRWPGRFTREEVEQILKLLRPSFDQFTSIGTRIGQSESEIIKATEEQYIQLDNAELNNGLIITGAAGTGKTTLASELFRRSVNMKRKTAFFCYNKLLGNKLARDHLPTTIIHSGCKVGTLHSAMHDWISKSSFHKELKTAEASLEPNSSKLFREIYPSIALKAATELGIKFDHVILDEAQDILSPIYVKLLNTICDKGLSEGRWTFFGDFVQQAIYGNINLESAIEALKSETLTRPAVSSLSINCRNSKHIATDTAKVSGFNRVPSRTKNVEGTEVSFGYYNKTADQADLVKAEIGKLLKSGLKYGDIVVLSTRRLSASGALGADSSGSFDLVDVTENETIKLQPKQVAFSTVHAFKGMEATAVIVCDIESVNTDEARSIVYVGMSRAKSHLVVLSNNKLRDTIVELRNRNLI